MRRAVAVLTRSPQRAWLEFLKDFRHYKVFLVIDDSKNYTELQKEYPTIQFIQIDTTECKMLGYTYVCYSPPDRKPVVAWEKAFFYFARLNTTYDQVWLIEDDVFFNNEFTLKAIDEKYETSGLLTSPYLEHKVANKNVWAWGKMDFRVPLPYYTAMVCACRVSKEIFAEIKSYAAKYRTLVLHETILSTFAKKMGLQYDQPEELVSIVYRREWKPEEINKRNVYHPIKDLEKHRGYREALAKI